MRRLISSLLAASMLIGVAVAPAAASTDDTIADIAIANGNFTTLVAALSCTGLVPAVSDPAASLTVFAPTDAAFEALFDALGVDGVAEIPVGLLTTVLLHHVAPGERFSGDVLGATRVRMLDKSFTHPRIQGGMPFIDDAAIVLPDVDVANGVIHVIDAVLLP